VRLWDVATGKPRLTLTGHTHQVHTVRYGADDAVLASGSLDGTVRLWDPALGRERMTLK
jgi:WD40 repeat protein